MAFKKGPAQAHKPGSKGGPQAGKKAPPPKKPQAVKADEDDDDLEEDDDFSMDEDSGLSGADEVFDDEELDDEELDDEELDEDEDLDEESEDADVPAGKAAKPGVAAGKADAQQQKGPNKQAQTPKQKVPVEATNGKRKAEDQEIVSPSKKIRLEEHIPASFVVDYESRDLCDVKLSSFGDGVTASDVKALCKDAVEVREKFRGKKLTCAFVRFANKEKATSAVQALQGAKLKGSLVTASYCGERWTNPALRPAYLCDPLDVRRVPKQYQNRKKLASIFPTGDVVKAFPDGYAQVKFPSSEALIKALKNPKCRTIDGQNLQFSVAVSYKDSPARLKVSSSAAAKPKSDDKAGSKSQKKRAKKAAKQKAGAESPVKGSSPGKKPGTPAPQSSPKTPGQQQQQKGPKTPGQQKGGKTPGKEGGPKTPGQPKGGAKTPGEAPKGTPKGTPKATPLQKKTPGLKGTPKVA
uniref:Putative nucleolar protein 12 n=1 Tax=Amblyomma sculptum TaxID=1581419 RepID=A0A1E1XM55_AMBSC